MEPGFIIGITSILITAIILIIVRRLINSKLQDLQGSDKLIGIVTIGIILAEVTFLGSFFGLFSFAVEIITSIGAAAVVLGIAFQNQLKNTIAGLSLCLNSQINVGDKIEFDYVRGTISGIHITKTVAITENGEKVHIPNHKFSEEMVVIIPKKY